MKVLLDIKDSKADFILELLKGFPSYVKTEHVSPIKTSLIAGGSNGRLQKKIEPKKTIKDISKTFAKGKKDWWDELTEAQQKAVEESIAEMKAGKLTSHADVMKKYRKWMKK